MKAFNSKLLMSDVLAERDIQKELKLKKKAHEVRVQQEWEELDKVKMEAFDEKVKEKYTTVEPLPTRMQTKRTQRTERKKKEEEFHTVKHFLRNVNAKESRNLKLFN